MTTGCVQVDAESVRMGSFGRKSRKAQNPRSSKVQGFNGSQVQGFKSSNLLVQKRDGSCGEEDRSGISERRACS
jgi:hypothetical protein